MNRNIILTLVPTAMLAILPTAAVAQPDRAGLSVQLVDHHRCPQQATDRHRPLHRRADRYADRLVDDL